MLRPQLSFDTSVKDVTDFYTSVFEGSTVNSYVSHQLLSGTFIEYSNMSILDQEFIIVNNGLPINELPALTFMLVYPKSEENLAKETFEKLKVDGTVYEPMVPEQPYGIVQDRYNM